MKRRAECCCSNSSIEVNGDPVLSGVCHCDDCKKRTGSAFGLSAYFPQKEIIKITGNFKSYCLDAETGSQERFFCKQCGTTLYWKTPTIKNCIGVAAGCFISPPLPMPEFVAYTENSCHWLIISELIKSELSAADIPQIKP